LVRTFNAAITGLFDLLFRPFLGLGPLWALTAVSVLAGVLLLWLFGKVSDQDTIRTVRDKVRGNLIAIRLFGDDLGLMFRLLGRLLRDNLIFMRYAFVPMLVLLVPVLVLLIQLDLRFGARPLEPGADALVKVTLRDPALVEQGVDLAVPEGVTIETPPVRIAALREIAWRIRAQRAGDYELVVRAGAAAVPKELRVGDGWGAVSARRTGGGLVDRLLHPGEPPLDGSSPVEAIEVTYAGLPLRAFGWSVDWLVFFFFVSLAAGFAFRRALGVEI
jgi:hypothetical protein